MKKTIAIAFGFLLILSLLFSNPVSPIESKTSLPVKDGNISYVDNADAYISAFPHTLTADGYVYLNITSKRYGGEVDLCFGFDSELAYPRNLELYDPKTETTQHELDLNPYWDNPDYQVDLSYNSTSKTGETVYDGYVSINQKINLIENNQTVGWEWTPLLSQHFDVGYLNTKMVHWKTTQTTYWMSIREDLNFDKESFTFQGMNTWYLANATMQKNREYYLRMWLTVVPTLEDVTHEYYVSLKPHGETLEQAIANKRFHYLDPWFDDGWLYRKNHTINSAAGAGEDYQIKFNVHSGNGDDEKENVYLKNKCRPDFKDIRFTDYTETALLDYWIDYMNQSMAIFWVKIDGDLSSSDQLIYIYYGNSRANSTTSDGTNTFLFFDGFSGSSYDTTKWDLTGDTPPVSGGEITISEGTSGLYWTHLTTDDSFSYTKCIIESEMKAVSTDDSIDARTPNIVVLDSVVSPTYYSENFWFDYDDKVWHAYGDGSLHTLQYYTCSLPTSYWIWRCIKETDEYTVSINHLNYTEIASDSTRTLDDVAFYIRIGVRSQCSMKADWVRIRKYVYPEPQHADAWGDEEGQEPLGCSFPDDWQYRKAHNITSAEGAGTNYPIRIVVHYVDASSYGDQVYLNYECQPDFDDIRFTDGNGWTLLDYWIEYKEYEDYAIFWVEVKDNLTSSNQSIYIYYGNDNEALSSTSDGEATFLFFDDFDGASLDTDKWTGDTGSASVSNSIVTLTATGTDVKLYQNVANYPAKSIPCAVECNANIQNSQ